MAYLVRKLPGAGSVYAARDSDGKMKTITAAGTVFNRAPAADPWLEIVEVSDDSAPAVIVPPAPEVQPEPEPESSFIGRIRKGKGKR